MARRCSGGVDRVDRLDREQKRQGSFQWRSDRQAGIHVFLVFSLWWKWREAQIVLKENYWYLWMFWTSYTMPFLKWKEMYHICINGILWIYREWMHGSMNGWIFFRNKIFSNDFYCSCIKEEMESAALDSNTELLLNILLHILWQRQLPPSISLSNPEASCTSQLMLWKPVLIHSSLNTFKIIQYIYSQLCLTLGSVFLCFF